MALVHALVTVAIQTGVLERPPCCEECGRFRFAVAHHDDYRNPLDVRWLCRECHGNWHSENGPGLNRDLAGFDVETRIPRPEAIIEEMRDLRRNGWTLQRIGEKYGFTREYARQIVGDIKAKQIDLSIVTERMPEIESLRNEGKRLKEIAILLNIEMKLLRRFTHIRRRVPIPHGTLGAYQNRGCRCDLCRAANTKRTIERNSASREMGVCISCKKPSSTWRCKDCNRFRNKRSKNKKVTAPEGNPGAAEEGYNATS
jgi:hypothetical protein